MNWKEVLEESIKGLKTKFETNELAFLALQGKIELQLRDKIAWDLEKKFRNTYYVKREYNPSGGRQKVDLAILNKEDKEPVCLIEFKAHSSANREGGYRVRCQEDCDKMRTISTDKKTTPEKFFVFFQSSHEEEDRENIETHSNIIAYVDYIKRGLKSKQGVEAQWSELFSEFGVISGSTVIEAGEYYGVTIKINTKEKSEILR